MPTPLWFPAVRGHADPSFDVSLKVLFKRMRLSAYTHSTLYFAAILLHDTSLIR